MAPPLSICTDLTESHDVLYESTLHTNSNRNLVENGMDTLTIKKEGVQNIGEMVALSQSQRLESIYASSEGTQTHTHTHNPKSTKY